MSLVIYGAYGYSGRMVAEEAVARGLRPTLAGRDPGRLREVARALDLDHTVVSLDDDAGLDALLAGAKVVVHCAGPFARTSKAMVGAALRTGTHYLDITGEIAVFEAVARKDAAAREAGVMLLPGAGFDVVPSDALAAHLKARLPTATHLVLAFTGIGGGVSHGTATTAVENLHQGIAVRRAGKIEVLPGGSLTREIDFGNGPRLAMAIPWGDVSTAFHSTGIPNIEVYLRATRGMVWGSRLASTFPRVVASGPVQRVLKGVVDRRPAGPDAEARARGFSLLWGEVRDAEGRRAAARMRTPEGYTLTARAAVHLARKALDGHAPIGFQTASTAYGADVVLELAGVTRDDIPVADGGPRP